MTQLVLRLRKQEILLRQMLLYGLIGGLSSCIDSGAYYILTRLYSLNEFSANFVSVNIGITISFILNTFYNFKMTSRLGRRAISFYSVGYMGLILSTFILYFGIHVIEINDLLVKIVSVFLVALFQFVLNKLITYKSHN